MGNIEKINIYDNSVFESKEYDIKKPANYLNKRIFENNVRMFNRLNYFFKWKSGEGDEGKKIIIPEGLEILLRMAGALVFIPDKEIFSFAQPVGFDNYNKPLRFDAISFGTEEKESFQLDASECIELKNNALGLPDFNEISFMSYEKAQTDVSRMFQLLFSRLTPLFETDSDKAFQAMTEALKEIEEGKPGIIKTSILDEVKTLDFLDPNAIAKMECLTNYDEILDKHIANRFGASLDSKNKKAQVSTEELNAYDDLTTSDYLANYEPRLEFCEEMRKAGFNIECIPNPIFADEPTEEEINDPELMNEEPEDPKPEEPKPEEEKEPEEGGKDEN